MTYWKHISLHKYDTSERGFTQAAYDELVAKGYSKVIEEDELEVLAQYHMEKFRNWMRPLMDPDAISSEITIQMPPINLPASKK